jgi:hypothetical protein
MADSPKFSSILDSVYLFGSKYEIEVKYTYSNIQTKLVYLERFFLYTWERLLETR